jgi:hypothetical protein
MRRKYFAAVTLALTILNAIVPQCSIAMGSGNRYQDLQTGVTYAVYQPTNTLKLAPLNFEVRPCRLFPKHDEYLLAGFGGMDLGIALVETSAQFNCTGLDNPLTLPSIKIKGISAKVGIYCPTTKCLASSFAKYGGEITLTMPATKTLKATFIRVGTQGGFSLEQLIAFTTGLKPVSAK